MKHDPATKTVHGDEWSLCYRYCNICYTDSRRDRHTIIADFMFGKHVQRIIIHLYYPQEHSSVAVSDSALEPIAEHIRVAMEWLGWQVEIRFRDRTEFANRTSGPTLFDVQDEGGPHYKSFEFRKGPSGRLLTEDGYCQTDTGLIIRPDGSVINPMNIMTWGLGSIISTEDIVIPTQDSGNVPPPARRSLRVLWDWISSWVRRHPRKADVGVDLTSAQKQTLDQMKDQNRCDSEFRSDGWFVELGWDFVKYRDPSGEQYYWECSRGGSDEGTPVTMFIGNCHTDGTFTTPCPLDESKKNEVLDRIVLALTNCGRFVFLTCQ